MMSQRSDQHSLFAADTQYLQFVGEESFYGFLAQHGRELFRDDDFAALYCPDFSRPSVPPSLLAMALLLQAQDRVSDQEPTGRGYRIRQGTARDRVLSVHEPEQRHGHKSQGRSFTGYKGAVAADVDSQLITQVEVIAGNEPDGDSAQKLVEESEANTGCEAQQVIGDTAYGSMRVRKELGERWQATAPASSIPGASGLKHRFRSPHERAPRNWPRRTHTIRSHRQKGRFPAGFPGPIAS